MILKEHDYKEYKFLIVVRLGAVQVSFGGVGNVACSPSVETDGKGYVSD
jgi:hypothetical protein